MLRMRVVAKLQQTQKHKTSKREESRLRDSIVFMPGMFYQLN